MVHIGDSYGEGYYSILLDSCTAAAFSLLFPKRNQSWCKIIKKVHINQYKDLKHVYYILINIIKCYVSKLYYFKIKNMVYFKVKSWYVSVHMHTM